MKEASPRAGEASDGARPTLAVQVIGWAHGLLGLAMLVSAAGGLAAHRLAGTGETAATPVEAPSHPAGPLVAFQLAHFEALALVQVGVALLVAFAGWSFLRRHAWSRLGLQALDVCGLLFVIAFGASWVVGWWRWHADGLAVSRDAGAAIRWSGAVLGLVATLGLASLPAASIYFLARREVREGFERG